MTGRPSPRQIMLTIVLALAALVAVAASGQGAAPQPVDPMLWMANVQDCALPARLRSG